MVLNLNSNEFPLIFAPINGTKLKLDHTVKYCDIQIFILNILINILRVYGE